METTYTWADEEQTVIKAVDETGAFYIPVDNGNADYRQIITTKAAIAAFVPPSDTTKT